MWYDTALQQQGLEKSLDLNIASLPLIENPAQVYRDLHRMLMTMGKTEMRR